LKILSWWHHLLGNVEYYIPTYIASGYHTLLSRRSQLKILQKGKRFRLESVNSMLLRHQNPFIIPLNFLLKLFYFSYAFKFSKLFLHYSYCIEMYLLFSKVTLITCFYFWSPFVVTLSRDIDKPIHTSYVNRYRHYRNTFTVSVGDPELG